MKRTLLVVALALVLIFAFTASAFATTGKFFARAAWTTTSGSGPTGSPAPGTAFVNDGLSTIGDNPPTRASHANYLATTAKCGICHSVHRAAGAGVKLLPTADASCAGCHTGTTITAKLVTWTLPARLDSIDRSSWRRWHRMDWRATAQRIAAITNSLLPVALPTAAARTTTASSTCIGDGVWDGTGTPPQPELSTGFSATAASPAVATPPTRTVPTARSTSSSLPSCCSTTPRAG